jgi:hypothetical protein
MSIDTAPRKAYILIPAFGQSVRFVPIHSGHDVSDDDGAPICVTRERGVAIRRRAGDGEPSN